LFFHCNKNTILEIELKIFAKTQSKGEQPFAPTKRFDRKKRSLSPLSLTDAPPHLAVLHVAQHQQRLSLLAHQKLKE
jgi:hypothetical protein